MIALIHSPFACIKAFHGTAEGRGRLAARQLSHFSPPLLFDSSMYRRFERASHVKLSVTIMDLKDGLRAGQIIRNRWRVDLHASKCLPQIVTLQIFCALHSVKCAQYMSIKIPFFHLHYFQSGAVSSSHPAD